MRLNLMSLLFVNLVFCWTYAASVAETRPNVVVFIADDMGYDDLGCYGHPHIRTPNIDGLASGGLRFDRAYLTCSSCSPSRCSILTSRYPHSTGAGELHLPLGADQVLVSTPLRDAGYWTIASGKWHLGNAVKPQFDLITEGGGPSGSKHWVKSIADRPLDKPFFAWLAAFDPHRSYQSGTLDPPHGRGDVVVPEIFPDTPEVRDDLAMYYDEIGRFDQNVGRVVDELRRQNVLDNTLIFVISDNGRPWPHCKTRVNVDGVRTPLVVHWPAGIVARGSTNSLVSSIDLAATVLDLAGIDPATTFQGVSFAPVLQDPETRVRKFAFAEHNWHDYRARERAVHTEDHAYVINAAAQLSVTPPADAVRSPTYLKMIELQQAGKLSPAAADVFRVPREPETFHDVVADPHCLNNLIVDPAVQDELDAVRAALRRFQADTADDYNGDLESLTPDGFDRQTGERLPSMKGSHPGKR